MVLLGLFVFTGCEETDIGTATQAGIEAIRAVTLDDEQVKRLASRLSNQSDLKHTVAPPGNPYTIRLKRLTRGHDQYGDFEFNFKVYLSPQVNAFAMADGSIRIYSGLMDVMDDRELQFVIGHEMGHVVKKHIKKKIQIAYASSAVRKAIASQQNEAGEIARSVLGALAESLINAQFSQQEEREADDFGVLFLKSGGHDVQPAISALLELAALGHDHSVFSSHPKPDSRAKRLQQNAMSPSTGEPPSLFQRIIDWLQALWPFGGDEQASLKSDVFI